jgi:PncC family amidohydrolase
VQEALDAAGLEAAELIERPDRTVVRLGAAIGRGEERLREAFGQAAVAAGDLSLARLLAASLTGARATLALAESCTGGLVSKLLTDVPGSSAFLLGGVVAYSNEAKEKLLGVPAAVISRHGAVSRPVVEAMARGAASAFGARLSASVSGVAGPDGGTADKPVGTVWVAALGPDRVEARRFLFTGDRERVRDLAAWTALLMLQERVLALAGAGRRGLLTTGTSE